MIATKTKGYCFTISINGRITFPLDASPWPIGQYASRDEAVKAAKEEIHDRCFYLPHPESYTLNMYIERPRKGTVGSVALGPEPDFCVDCKEIV